MIQRACQICGALSDRQRCPAHRAKDTRPSAAARGYDGAWRLLRARFLRTHRICQHPGCPYMATEVHHVDGGGPLGWRGLDESNLQALCKEHHSLITAQMQPGGFFRKSDK